ncbi:caspase family protein [Streptomyces sp. NPDC093514]|uniref:caspase, EACC1-associated type n=1 Tax=Streptomyces sp. NPDC093514 TaxID=3366039 RepID=UPI003820CE44
MSDFVNPSGTRAVLIGVASYAHLDDISAVANNLAGLASALSAETSWKLPVSSISVLSDPASASVVIDEIAAAARAASDTLLVYYTGHGLLDRNSDLYWGLPGALANRPDTGVLWDWVRHAVTETRAKHRVVILDCCFSGRAVGAMAAEGMPVEKLYIGGSFVLASSGATTPSLANPGEEYSVFTGELLDIMRHGVQAGPKNLDLQTIYDSLHERLYARSLPVPRKSDRDGGGKIVLARNVSYTSERGKRRLRRPAVSGLVAESHSDVIRSIDCTEVEGAPVAVTVSDDGMMSVWDIVKRKRHGLVNVHDDGLNAVACHNFEGSEIAITGSDSGTLHMWDLASLMAMHRHPLKTFKLGGYRVVDLARSTLRGRPAVISVETRMEDMHRDSYRARIWDLVSQKPAGLVGGSTGTGYAVACAESDGETFVVVGSEWEAKIRTLDSRMGRLERKHWFLANPFYALSCAELRGRATVLAGRSSGLQVWDLRSKEKKFELDTGSVTALVSTLIDQEPVALVSGSKFLGIQVWSLASRERLLDIGAAQRVTAIGCLDIDGAPIAVTGDVKGNVGIWDLGKVAKRRASQD